MEAENASLENVVPLETAHEAVSWNTTTGQRNEDTRTYAFLLPFKNENFPLKIIVEYGIEIPLSFSRR